MDTSSSEAILVFASEADLVQSILTALKRADDRIIQLEKEVADLKQLDSFRMNQIVEDRQRLAKLERIPAKPGKKSDARKKALANALLSRHNEGMTFAETGKFLELGSRKNGKSTREQNMTHFGKLLSADKKNFVVSAGKTSGGYLVKLTKIYYEHLLRGESP